MSEKANPRDHRWALGACIVLVLVLVGGTIGAWAYGARRQRLAVEALTGVTAVYAPAAPPGYSVSSGSTGASPGGSVGFTTGTFTYGALTAGSVEYGFQLNDNLDLIVADPPGPEWLRDWLGIDYLATVRGATIQLNDDSLQALRALGGLRSLQTIPFAAAWPPITGSAPPAIIIDGPLVDPLMSLLPSFTLLEKLVLSGAPVRDNDLAALAKLPRLRIVDLNGCSAITDAGLAQIGKIAGLKTLSLSKLANLTDVGLAQLAALKNLEQLEIETSQPDQFSSEAINDLRAHLPRCLIHFENAPAVPASPPIRSASPGVFYSFPPPTPPPSSSGSPSPAGP